MTTPRWNTLSRWSTGFSADSVEWCPVPAYHDVMVCGTYQLHENDGAQQHQKRLGRIYLFRIDSKASQLSPIDTIECSGILDQKWCHHKIQDSCILAAVTSDGFLRLYKLIDNATSLKLELWLEANIGENILALSVDWSTNKQTTSEPRLVVSDSRGRVTVFRVLDKLDKVGEWMAHKYEAWIAAFNYWNPDVFYSGGDDCIFKSFDVRIPETAAASVRSHDAGVTSVRSHTEVEQQILTGSYDENVRIWDARSLKRPLSQTNVNGGVWRLKYHPYRSDLVLAACMYGGFRMLQINDGDITAVADYMEHESIAYGADWQVSDVQPLVATCSFYDCKLHISQFELK